ncbi:MAG: hypothetical protein ACMUIE_04490 [Thermoplasmatota archaeon]
MEERLIELLVEGVSIGTSFTVEASSPAGPARIGETRPLELTVTSKSELPALSLKLLKTNGVSVACDGITSRMMEQGKEAKCTMDVVYTGTPGPSVLHVVLKGESYFATLGLTDLDVIVLPSKVSANLIGAPVSWNGRDLLDLEIELTRPEKERIKGRISGELVTSDGKRQVCGSFEELNVDSKGPAILKVRISPASDLNASPMDLQLRMDLKDGVQKELIREAILAEGAPQEEVSAEEKTAKMAGTGITPIPIKALDISFEPKVVVPGGSTKFRISYWKPGTCCGDLTCSLDLEGVPGSPFILEIGGDGGGAEKDISFPEDQVTGIISGKIEIRSGSDTVLSIPIDTAVSIQGASELRLALKTPKDLDDNRPITEHGDLLFPGETVVSRDVHEELACLRTSTGRHILVMAGKVVFGNGWEGGEVEVRSRLSEMVLRDLFINNEGARLLQRCNENIGRLHMLSSIIGETDISPENWFDALPVAYGDSTAGVVSGAVLQHWSETKGSLTNLTKEMGRDHPDPLPSINNHLIRIISAAEDTSGLRDYLENVVMEIKSSRTVIEPASLNSAGLICAKELRRALRSFRKGLDIPGSLRKMVLNTILGSLVRVELFTGWNGMEVNTWDDLRTVRQKALKGEIGFLYQLLERMDDAVRTVNSRLGSYMKNMEVRRGLSSLDSLRMINGDAVFHGMGGEVWSGKVTLGFDTPGETVRGHLYMKLPGPGWKPASSSRNRIGEIFDLGPVALSEDGTIQMDIRLRAPAVVPENSTAMIYAVLEDHDLEVEP